MLTMAKIEGQRPRGLSSTLGTTIDAALFSAQERNEWWVFPRRTTPNRGHDI